MLTTDQRYALVQRVFLKRNTTRAFYIALKLKPPWFVALTYLGRVKQFYRHTGRQWPWKD